MNKVEGKVSDFCPKCKNCKGVTNEYDGKTASIRLTEVECEDPYDGMIKTLTADSDICCSMFEMKSEKSCDKISLLQHELEMDKLRRKIHELEKEKADHLKGIKRLKKSQEKLQNQVKNLQTTNEESYKRDEKLEDKVRRLERRLLEENKRFVSLDSEFLIPLAHVLYPREAKICKPYSEVIEDIKRLDEKNELLEQRYDNIHYTLYKDWSDDSISCPSDIPSDVEMIEDLKKRAADSDYYKEMSELLEERNNNQFDTIREKNKEIGELEEELKKANELADSWKRDYERLRDQFICPIYNILYPDKPDLNINVTDLINDIKNLKVYSEENGTMYKEIQEWREKCIARGDEISKLQNIVTEKHAEIKGLKRDIIVLHQNKFLADTAMKKNNKLRQTISDQEITIKALLITIKEMCKEDETNE